MASPNVIPPEAPIEVRQRILDALKAERYMIYDNGRRFLEAMGFAPDEMICQDVVGYLEDGCRLYCLTGPDIVGEKYQCCIHYEESLIVHVKLTPSGDGSGFHVKLGFHRHNTGYAPLPS
jgi:hypothetical protein